MKYLLTSLLVFSIMCTGVLNAQYIQYGNGINPPADFAAHPDDLAGLQALYDALDGPNWTIPNHVKWRSTPLAQDGVTPFFYHIWYMVHFNDNHRVAKLIFWPGDGLNGAIPPEISKLTELQEFIIDGNTITDISNIRNLPNLKTLQVMNCNLSGQIPCIVEDLPSLNYLELTNNALSGDLPECLAGPNSTVQKLVVTGNALTGCIPDNYNRFCSVYNREYCFSNNSFENTIADVCSNVPCDGCPQQYPILWDFYQSTGGPNWTNVTAPTITVGDVDVPYMITWWKDLYDLYGFFDWQGIQSIIEFQPILPHVDFVSLINFYQNNPGLVQAGTYQTVVSDTWFEDCDPCGLQDGTPWKGITCNANNEITHIYLHSSNLIGSLPSSLSGLTSLQSLNLANNQLSGTIPTAYAALTGLQIWNIEDNQLSGVCPSYLNSFNYLQYLNFANNNLSGILLSDFSNLSYLKEFRVNNNQITGTVSNTIENCLQLIHFDASDNILSGSLPPGFGALPDLTHIYLDENQFTGQVPGQWGDLQSIVRIDVSQNQLTRTLFDDNLEKLCPINTIANVHINDGNNIDELWSMMCNCVDNLSSSAVLPPPQLADPNLPCCQVFADDLIIDGDGNQYTASRIGNQIWLKENLMTSSCLDGTPLPNYILSNWEIDHYTTEGTGTPLYVWPYRDIDMKVPWGALYSHYIFNIDNDLTLTSSGFTNPPPYTDGAVCQICPQGYRLPNSQDYVYLFDYIKSMPGYHPQASVSDTDIFKCFRPTASGEAVSGGNGYINYVGAGGITYLWSSNIGTIQTGWDFHILHESNIESYNSNGHHTIIRTSYRSLRCIKE